MAVRCVLYGPAFTRSPGFQGDGSSYLNECETNFEMRLCCSKRESKTGFFAGSAVMWDI